MKKTLLIALLLSTVSVAIQADCCSKGSCSTQARFCVKHNCYNCEECEDEDDCCDHDDYHDHASCDDSDCSECQD